MSDEIDCPCDSCGASTCECAPTPTPTLCDRDRVNNMWVVGGDPPCSGNGICLLDTMCLDQIVYTLQHNPNAAKDLDRVTSNVELRNLAATVPLLPTTEEADKLQSDVNRHKEIEGIPYYAIFRGNPPYAQ